MTLNVADMPALLADLEAAQAEIAALVAALLPFKLEAAYINEAVTDHCEKVVPDGKLWAGCHVITAGDIRRARALLTPQPAATESRMTCPNCHGTKLVDDQTCTYCDGDGWVLAPQPAERPSIMYHSPEQIINDSLRQRAAGDARMPGLWGTS